MDGVIQSLETKCKEEAIGVSISSWRPSWAPELRPQQSRAIEDILGRYDAGVDVVVVDAPTGSGKTLIAEIVRRSLGQRGTYVCSGLSLQDQFLRDFPTAQLLKGRANYSTMFRPDLDCSDCMGARCKWCEPRNECAYVKAKMAAMRGELAVLNTSYLLTMHSSLFIRPFVTIDECDVLEGAMLRHWEFRVTDKAMASLGVTGPVKGARLKTICTWLEEELVPAATRDLEGLKERAKNEVYNVEVHRSVEKLENLVEHGELLLEQLKDDRPWVRDYVYGRGDFLMKPVEVSVQGAGALWDMGKGREYQDKRTEEWIEVAPTRWLCMSGTVVDAEEWVRSVGVEEAGLTWDLVTVPMTWDKHNRPIIPRTVANMAKKSMDEEFPKLMEELCQIVRSHKGTNILVHCVSYSLMRNIVAWLRREGLDAISYDHAGDRDLALNRFRDEGGVIVAPSLDRGVDLPDDLCGVCVVAKMPYLSLGDRQVSERLHMVGGQLWYDVQTARSLVQSTGRGVRHADDRCVMYVLDKSFDGWYRKNKKLLPKWWREAIVGELPDDWNNDTGDNK